MINYEEQFIFKQMVEGNKKAFRYFFEKYYADLCNFINFYIKDSVISEEIAQDIFVYLWEKKSTIRIESSVKSYLFRASKNKSLNYIRNEKTKQKIYEKLANVSVNSIDEIPENCMDTNHLRELITKSFSKLPPRCREIFIMAKEEDFSYKDIAESLGISVKTVENQMGKALKILRENLYPYYKEIFTLFITFLFTR